MPDADRMSFVPAGPFGMGGSAPGSAALPDGELPRHRVVLDAFCLDRFLVTNDAYAAFLAATGRHRSRAPLAGLPRRSVRAGKVDARATARRRLDPLPQARADHPVVLISAQDPEAYCRWRSRDARRPTEEQWEKAARGDDGWSYPWGPGRDAARANSADRGPGSTTPVMRYPQGALPRGMLDAADNVAEWTASRRADGRRVVKGGTWDDEPARGRAAFRQRLAGGRSPLTGFRGASTPGMP